MEENQNDTKHDTKQDIIDTYLKILKRTKSFPSVPDMTAKGISKDKIKYYFGNITKLHDYMNTVHIDDINELVLTEKTLFTPKKKKELSTNLRKFSRFVISTVVSGKEVDKNFLKCIKNYCEVNDATLILMPCADLASRNKQRGQWQFDPVIKNENIVFDDTEMNSNLFLNSIKLSAKNINPLTGLSRMGQRNGSFIYASPKQFLEYVATSPSKEKIPHAIMTTGAITKSEYKTDRYMSERTSVIAESDHVMGAVIVEIKDDKIFHFRQVQANKNGSFTDLGIKYSKKGTKKVKTNLVPGDWHSGSTDRTVISAIGNLAMDIEIDNIILHDFYDGKSISHHDIGRPGVRAKKAMHNLTSLERELKQGASDLNMLSKLVSGNIVMVKSNHDEVLERYLTEGRYIKDPENHFMALDLARQSLMGVDPLKYAFETYGGIDPDVMPRIKWLKRDEEYRIGGVECGQHGDMGANGSKGSLDSLEKAYGNCVIGHAHTAAIKRGVFRVGTSTEKRLDYTRGPSSWTHTGCLVYEDGSRQLVNFIFGEYKL